jgi:hypothetical protein
MADFNVLGYAAKYDTRHVSIVPSIVSLLSSFLIVERKLFGEAIVKLKDKVVADLFVLRALVVEVP